MRMICLEVSRYVFAFFAIFYTLCAYKGAVTKREEKRFGVYIIQNLIIFATHFFGYLIIYIEYEELKYFILYFAEFVFLFLVIMIYYFFYPKASRLLINNMCMLLVIGFIMIARLDFDKCVKQFIIACVGVVITVFVPAILKHFKSFRDLGWIYCFVGLGLLVMMLFGNKVFGANLVLTIGSFSVQPAEFVKILYVFFVASMFNKSTSFKQTVVVTVIAALHVIILVLSTDLGAALIFFIVYLMMLFVASRRITYMIAGLCCGGAASLVAYKLFSHVRDRVTVWLDPWSYIDTTGYQICQSLFAIGMGSWFGYGLCQGMPERIPVAEKDFMFAAISEEFGIIFSVSILLICLNNLILMMNIASRCRTLFYRLVAVGLGVTYGFQVFLTVGGAIKLIPMTGVTLPFVSYGGSSLIGSLFMFALINGMYNMRHDESEFGDGKQKVQQRQRG